MLWLSVVVAGNPVWTSEESERRALVERLYHQEVHNLIRLAGLFADDRTGAEDIVQEAFIRFYRSADRIRDTKSSAAYLRSIVVNLARDYNRRGLLSLRHQDALVDRRPAEEPDQEVARSETQAAVLAALDRLSPRQRQCVILRFHMELSEREIAATLAISANSVKTHIRRGMAELARLLEVER